GRGRPFGETVRGRRSALDFVGGDRSIGRDDFEALLAAARRPFGSDFDARLVHLYAWVHRVRGLEAGVYRCDLEAGTVALVMAGDQRMAVAGLSLNQDLAGNACVAFSMIADLQRAFRLFGDRGYRYSLFEAGAIGHRFYLASEALGFRSTGIGAFYDDRVHQYLDIDPSEGQVVYHFACGYPVHDPRLDAR
ncbi:MAG: SagB/ThcOx family dehydrogenase, partial [Bryobacteraceae bacterium]